MYGNAVAITMSMARETKTASIEFIVECGSVNEIKSQIWKYKKNIIYINVATQKIICDKMIANSFSRNNKLDKEA